MATSDLLQIPKIIDIVGSTIRVSHPDTNGYVSTRLSAPIAAAGTAMLVYDNNGFADDDWMVVGPAGQSKTETTDVNGAVTRGNSMTVTNALSFPHSIDAPVTKIPERGIAIYGAATDGGALTLIASIDAITAAGRQLADATMIQWDKPYTEYTMITTDTAYAYYVVKFTDGTTLSSASAYVLAAGPTYNTIEPLIQRALDNTNSRIDDKKLTREMLVDWAQDCQEAIMQFTYQDPTTGRFQQKDWSFEVTEDTLTSTENENRYAMSGLSNATKYPNSSKSFISGRLGTLWPLKWFNIDDYDEFQRDKSRTDLAAQAVATDTSITVDDTSDFDDSGSIYLGAEIVTYTAKTPTTFTGIPATGTGAITTTHAIDSPVWQGIAPGRPYHYTLFEGVIMLDLPVDATYAGQKIKIRHYKALDRLTSVSSTTPIPFTNVFPTYISAKIEQRQGKMDKYQLYMAEFNKQVTANAQADFAYTTDEYTYHAYQDGTYRRRYDDVDSFNYNY